MRVIRYLKSRSLFCCISMKRLRNQHCRLTCGLIVTLIFFASYTLLENSDARLKDYYRKKNILPIVRLADYDTEDAQQAKRLYPRQILFWTSSPNSQDKSESGSESEGHPAFCLKSKQLQHCPYKCDFTTDRSYFEIADAVVFDCQSLQLKKKTIWESIWTGLYDEHEDIPEFRMHRQVWVFQTMKSPDRTWVNLKPFESLFNWTMSYRRDSDVYTPFGHFIPIAKPEAVMGKHGISDTLPQNGTTMHSKIRGRKLAAWALSNCQYEPSGSKEYIKELQKYIPIDIFGKCGARNCSSYTGFCQDPLACYEAIGEKYKFFFAFESSLCVDYISDKFYNALRVGMVPVVFGNGDYSKVSPRNSYIDARSFDSAEKLAQYLLFLHSEPREFLRFFEWKSSYSVKNVNHFEGAWCSLCEKLWKTPSNATYQESASARDLENWWYHSNDSPFEPACSHSM